MSYTMCNALQDSKTLYKLHKKREEMAAMIDKEIEAASRELAMLEGRREEMLSPIDEECSRLESNLKAFHRAELENGGEKTIKLPYVTLKSRKQAQSFKRDDDMLLAWADANDNTLVKVTRSVDWNTMKKRLVVDGDKVIDKDTGTAVDGVEALPIEVNFNCEVLEA